MRNDLVVVGNISQDNASYCGTSRRFFWGGAGLNISVTAAQFGKRPRLISVVGEDAIDILSELKKHIDISLVKVLSGKTCRFEIHYSRDGTLQNINCDFGVASFLNQYFQTIDLPLSHYHVCCRQPLDPHQVIQRIIEKVFPFSLDFILSSAHQQMSQAKKWIQYAKHVFVNLREFEILRSFYDISDVQTLVVTSDGHPIRVFNSGREVLCQSQPMKKFRDVTGAGDVFIGTFLASQLKGEALYKSIKKASSIAQKSLDSIGIMPFFLLRPSD